MAETVDPIYYPDKAIQSETSDRFNFNPTAEVLAKNISRLSVDDSYTIAVNGEWGSGKSSFLNLVRQHLETSDEDEIKNIVLDFDPWMFSGREDVVMQLFLHIRAELQNLNNERKGYLNPNIFSTLDSVLGCLQSISSLSGIPGIHGIIGGIKFGNQILADKNQDKIDEINNINAQRKQLCNKLKNLSAKLVIIIDNIDRLTGTEIRQIFQAIKAVSDFPNIVYILAYDQRIVEDALEFEFHQHYSATPESGREYLKKIVQFSLPVPDTTPYLKKYVEDIILELNDRTSSQMRYENPFLEERWNRLYQYGLSPLLKTPRDIIRLHNTLILISASFNQNLDYLDLISIQVLREYEPELYETIKHNPRYFMGKSYNFSDYDKVIVGINLENIEYSGSDERVRYFRELTAKYKDKWHILFILTELFSNVKKLCLNDNELKSIMLPYILDEEVYECHNSMGKCGLSLDSRISSFMQYFGCSMDVSNFMETLEDYVLEFWDPEKFVEIISKYHYRQPSSSYKLLDDLSYCIEEEKEYISEENLVKITQSIFSLDIDFFENAKFKYSGLHFAWKSARNVLISLLKCGDLLDAVSRIINGIDKSKNIVLISFIVAYFHKLCNRSEYTINQSDKLPNTYSFKIIREAYDLFREPYVKKFNEMIGDNPMNLSIPYIGDVYVASQISSETKEKIVLLTNKIWNDEKLFVEFVYSIVDKRLVSKSDDVLHLVADKTQIENRVESIMKKGIYPQEVIHKLEDYIFNVFYDDDFNN